jgi:2-polyprenyl-3-methyl-5-hydroxy-6-metoxy-1,4-benzoquinol methylase
MSETDERLALWDGRYKEGNLPWNTEKPSTELVKFLESGRIRSGTAVDLGCGFGTNAIYLARQGFTVTGADLSPTAIEGARERAERAGVKADFRVADLTADPDLGGPYDLLFDRGVYHILRNVDLAAYLRALEKASRPGSLYLCLTGNAKEEREFGPPRVSEEEIRGELGGLFQVLDLHEFRFDASPQVEDRPLGWSALMERK